MIYNLNLERHIYECLKQKAVAFGWHGNCVPVSIILSECLHKAGISNRLVSGYLHISNSSERIAVYHCWVETKLGKLDIASDICEVLFPQTAMIGCSKECAVDLNCMFERCDIDTKADCIMRSETERLYDIYMKSDKDTFWKSQKVSEFEHQSFQKTVMFRLNVFNDLKSFFWL